MRPPRLTYANVVSTLCLFVLLGGGAYAAASQLAKNSVGTRQLRRSAVTGAKVKDGSLSGADVRAGTLGRVPLATRAESAAHADSAGDAASLGGRGAASFLPRADLPRIDYLAHWETDPDSGEPRKILEAGPLTLGAICFDSELGGTKTLLELTATGAPGSTIDYANTTGEDPAVGVVDTGPAPSQVFILRSGPDPVVDTTTLVYRDDAETISASLGIHVGIDDSCSASGIAVVSH